MVAGLLLSQTVCFDRRKELLPLWALQHWQMPGQRLHLAVDTTILWNRHCVVILSLVCHGRAVPLLWTALEHTSPSVSAEICIALLDLSSDSRLWCEELFRDQKSGLFELESIGLRQAERIDRMLLVVAIGVLVASLQGSAISLSGLRRQVDTHWQRGMSLTRIGLKWMLQSVSNLRQHLQAWAPIPLRELEPCISSRGDQRRCRQPWFTRVELPPRTPRHEQICLTCQPPRLPPLVEVDHIDGQLLGDLVHALPMGWPHPTADISLDGLAVRTHRSIPSGPWW